MVFLNGEYVAPDQAKVSVFDRGYLFGDGAYEVVPIFGGKSFLLSEHVQRLKESLAKIDIHKYEIDLEQIVATLLSHEQEGFNGMIYVKVSRGQEPGRNHSYVKGELEPTTTAFLQSVSFLSAEERQQGFRARVEQDFRWHRCDIKSISLLPNVMLKHHADEAEALEVILLRDEEVTEASASNVFIVREGEVLTHPADEHILNGITRQFLIKELKAIGFTCHEQKFNREELFAADEVWVTSSTKKVLPIIEISGNKIGTGQPGEVWEKAINLFPVS